jgi:hypothetical protein
MKARLLIIFERPKVSASTNARAFICRVDYLIILVLVLLYFLVVVYLVLYRILHLCCMP